MAINKNSNVYIIIYTIVMVVIVGALLAFLATSLKPMQDENKLKEKKSSIMKAFKAKGDFDELVTIYRLNGTELSEVEKDAQATIFEELEKRGDLAKAERDLPLFKYAEGDVVKYVIPLVGKGLWGDIWGYVAVQPKDGNVVITGVVMAHAGETPGLGAEIATDGVQDKFFNKALYNEAGEFSVRMQKGGARNGHEVDAITGGTKTCDGVNAMLKDCISKYEAFLKAEAGSVAADTEVADVKPVRAADATDAAEAADGELVEEIVEPTNVEEK